MKYMLLSWFEVSDSIAKFRCYRTGAVNKRNGTDLKKVFRLGFEIEIETKNQIKAKSKQSTSTYNED